MAVSLLVVDGVEVSALRFRQGQAATHGGGSGRRLGGRSGFRVDTPGSVLTATSTTWTLGPCAAMIDPGATTHQGVYGWASDTNISGSIDPAHDTYPRKDIVFIQVNDSSAGDGSGALNANVRYVAGTPSANPVAPDLGVLDRTRSFLVGTITVPQLNGGSPTVALNPARYAAAGAALPVYSQAERDAIPDKYDGLIVQRRDLPGRPNFVWDGSGWNGQVWTDYTPSWGGWINLGDGYQATGSYMMIGPNLCTVRMKLKAGSANTNLGTGSLAVSLPFTSAPGLTTNGDGQWLGSGPGGGLQKIMLSNPGSNNLAAIYTNPSGTSIAQPPGAAGFGYGSSTEVHATITYRTA